MGIVTIVAEMGAKLLLRLHEIHVHLLPIVIMLAITDLNRSYVTQYCFVWDFKISPL